MHLAQRNAKQGHGSIHQGVGLGSVFVRACVWVVGAQLLAHTCQSCASTFIRTVHVASSSPLHLHTRGSREHNVIVTS